ncbi:MAG: ergothioneine biosynthesis protein EgtB [Sphingomonadales bacterium]|nr:ergothioneine biosynthesis protein EgtB [Sphingomonadales bacterium]
MLTREAAVARFRAVRALSESLAAPLSAEDMTVQSMPDVSPTKWHLAHTSWFFETFLLKPYGDSYRAFDPDYHYLFNSYYEAEGPRHPRPERGQITRPSVEEIRDYRRHVTEAMVTLLDGAADSTDWRTLVGLMELGCQHEEQHQELILTDIKHVLYQNPLLPAYGKGHPKEVRRAPQLAWAEFDGGLVETGHDGEGFAFDCETPRHKVWLEPFRLANRLVTNGEYVAFIQDDGYRRPELWLSDGWMTIQEEGWSEPLYWRQSDDGWHVFTLHGAQPINLEQPVCHLSYFEADAYARWAGARLPGEAELEVATAAQPDLGHVNDQASGHLHPDVARPGQDAGEVLQLSGDVWEWTRSAYAEYPGFKPAAGAIGEYNGKFMCNQFVLRGGSCATPGGHWRPTYRNFFPAHARWQFTGLRLAKDL